MDVQDQMVTASMWDTATLSEVSGTVILSDVGAHMLGVGAGNPPAVRVTEIVSVGVVGDGGRKLDPVRMSLGEAAVRSMGWTPPAGWQPAVDEPELPRADVIARAVQAKINESGSGFGAGVDGGHLQEQAGQRDGRLSPRDQQSEDGAFSVVEAARQEASTEVASQFGDG